MNIGWFSSGRDEAARQLLQVVWQDIEAGEIQGKISFVFSNRELGEAKESDMFFDLVQRYDIPLICFSYRKFKEGLPRSARNDKKENWRIKYDREVDRRIEKFAPAICVLAGYMLIIGAELCQKYNMLNLHPAPPGGPTGSWQEVIRKLIESNAEEAGAMIHLVTPELDKGPPVTYCIFPIKGKPFDRYWDEIKGHPVSDIKKRQGENNRLFQLIREHELVREFPLIILTLQALSRGEISITGGKVISAQGEPIEGYDLSAKIDQAVEEKIAEPVPSISEESRSSQ